MGFSMGVSSSRFQNSQLVQAFQGRRRPRRDPWVAQGVPAKAGTDVFNETRCQSHTINYGFINTVFSMVNNQINHGFINTIIWLVVTGTMEFSWLIYIMVNLWLIVVNNWNNNISGWWFGTWILFFHFIYMGCHPSHWRTPSFLRGVGIPPTSICFFLGDIPILTRFTMI